MKLPQEGQDLVPGQRHRLGRRGFDVGFDAGERSSIPTVQEELLRPGNHLRLAGVRLDDRAVAPGALWVQLQAVDPRLPLSLGARSDRPHRIVRVRRPRQLGPRPVPSINPPARHAGRQVHESAGDSPQAVHVARLDRPAKEREYVDSQAAEGAGAAVRHNRDRWVPPTMLRVAAHKVLGNVLLRVGQGVSRGRLLLHSDHVVAAEVTRRLMRAALTRPMGAVQRGLSDEPVAPRADHQA